MLDMHYISLLIRAILTLGYQALQSLFSVGGYCKIQGSQPIAIADKSVSPLRGRYYDRSHRMGRYLLCAILRRQSQSRILLFCLIGCITMMCYCSYGGVNPPVLFNGHHTMVAKVPTKEVGLCFEFRQYHKQFKTLCANADDLDTRRSACCSFWVTVPQLITDPIVGSVANVGTATVARYKPIENDAFLKHHGATHQGVVDQAKVDQVMHYLTQRKIGGYVNLPSSKTTRYFMPMIEGTEGLGDKRRKIVVSS